MAKKIDSNERRPANIIKRPSSFPARKKNGRNYEKKSRGDGIIPKGSIDTENIAFSVKVRRKWDSARTSFFKKFHLYEQLNEFPLGLIIDVWA